MKLILIALTIARYSFAQCFSKSELIGLTTPNTDNQIQLDTSLKNIFTQDHRINGVKICTSSQQQISGI
jgi:hypothetical protein